MRIPLAISLLMILLAWSGTAAAQVYRCGNSYSTTPCSGGRAVDTSPTVSAAPDASTAQVYLCNGYGGGQFWAKNHCNQHSALVERIESVPASLPWDQQVALAQSQREKASTAVAQRQQRVQISQAVSTMGQPDKTAQCQSLDEQVRVLDQRARVGGTAQYMDWLAGERKRVRDLQFGLKC